METCFRFLINVDQCLNMSNFDIFFYKLESQHKFHLNQVQLFGDSFGTSLRHAVSDIRMYLDKYPYHVGDYQLIVAMRGMYKKRSDNWEETMLYRLLQLNFELRRSRIFINSQESAEKALNLIMLYDADFSTELPKLGDYMTSCRFQTDCALFLRHIGIADPHIDYATLKKKLMDYGLRDQRDPAVLDLLKRFLLAQDSSHEFYDQTEEDSLYHFDAEQAHEPDLVAELMPFLKDQFLHYHVFEALIDRNNRRHNILSLLRVVEFINMSTDRGPTVQGDCAMVSLAQRCKENWDKVWQDTTLEQRYSTMLRQYQATLTNAQVDLDHPTLSSPTAKNLPEEDIPRERELFNNDGIFAGSDSDKQSIDMHGILDKFINSKFTAHTMTQDWNAVYQKLKKGLESMDHDLKCYAEDLSHQYSSVLDERKRDTSGWKNSFDLAQPDTEKQIRHIEYERDQRLQLLKSPHMTPSLKFQDQLNMENELEQQNLNIRFYSRCIHTVTAVNFLLLVILTMAYTLVHYTVLQPYVYQNSDSLLYYLMYLGILVILMLLFWRMPYLYFRRKIKKCIELLQKSMDKYISGYFEKADQFCTYINLLNQLDYITRYHRLLKQAHHTTNKLAQGYLWHKVQVQHHLEKLHFFQGLIDLSDASDIDESSHRNIPAINGDRVSDVIDSPIYWPQG